MTWASEALKYNPSETPPPTRPPFHNPLSTVPPMIDQAFKYMNLLGTILIQTTTFYWLVTQTLTPWQDPGDPGTTGPPGHP